MATQKLSPTGNLLRNSRLFSLPPPLPRPSATLTASQRFDSATATLPYPTQAAIETTPASLARGDWGLKRSLPLKSTARTSTPIIRIGDVDSINHITDFESAADHALNLKKWQEMGLPISKTATPRNKVSQYPKHDVHGQQYAESHRSVFESTDDNTEAETPSTQGGRWKYKGPWLAGQTQGEFNDYAERTIRKRKGEFGEFLRERLAQKVTGARRRVAIDSGEMTPIEPVIISDSDLGVHIKGLRTDEATMFRLIEEFLDLPSTSRASEIWTSTDSVEGPPTTHPSAGLSYLRAGAHTLNHPVLGPQRDQKPLRGRVLAAQSPRRTKAIIGVSGIVAEDSRFKALAPVGAGVNRFEPDIPGGAKIWVKPERITIDSQGQIKLQLARANERTVSLYEETPEEPAKQPMIDPKVEGQRQIPDMTSSAQKPATRGLQGYGLNLSGASMRSKAPKAIGRPDTRNLLDVLDNGRRV